MWRELTKVKLGVMLRAPCMLVPPVLRIMHSFV